MKNEGKTLKNMLNEKVHRSKDREMVQTLSEKTPVEDEEKQLSGYCVLRPANAMTCIVFSLPLCFADIDLGPGPGFNAAGKHFLVLLCIGALLLALVYILPSIIAFQRGHRYRWPILIINIVFGATVIGYVVALIWSIWPSGEKNLVSNAGAKRNEQDAFLAENAPLKNTVSDKMSFQQPTEAHNEDQSVMGHKEKELLELRNTLENAKKTEYGTGKKLRRVIGKPIGILFFLLAVITVLAGIFPAKDETQHLSLATVFIVAIGCGLLGLIALNWGIPNKKRIRDLEEKVEKLSAGVTSKQAKL
jgi:hypothetical protein